MFIAKVKRTIKKYGMLSHGDRVVVAVSGGPDSVCLLSVLRTLVPEYDLRLHIAHLDHMFRGPGSAADARFVNRLAAKLGIPATIEAIDVPAYCRERGLSAQEGARDVRYRFLDRVAGSVAAGRIAVGHTANDQAETILMRLTRGAGPEALAGIPPLRDKIIRPLLGATRAEIRSWLQEEGLDFVSDPTNEQPVYTRNWIRLNIIPELERLNPRAVEALAAGAALLHDEAAALDQMLDPVGKDVLRREREAVHIDRSKFLALVPAARRRVLRAAVVMWSADIPGLSRIQTDEAIDFMDGAQTGRVMALHGGLILERSYADFVLRPQRAQRTFCIPVTVPGTTAVVERSLTVHAEVIDGPAAPQESGNYLWQAQFDYAKIALPLSLRSRREGDRFCPAGMGGRSKKLQDFFVDEKVFRSKREEIPILATDRDVLWVVGMRIDERFRPGPKTEKRLVVTVRPLDMHCQP